MRTAEERSIMATTAALEAREVQAVFNDDAAAQWRFEQFVKLEFTVPQAERLAMTRAEDGTWLYEDAAIALLERGCSHEVAFDILI